jgi:hypothetical protein
MINEAQEQIINNIQRHDHESDMEDRITGVDEDAVTPLRESTQNIRRSQQLIETHMLTTKGSKHSHLIV